MLLRAISSTYYSGSSRVSLVTASSTALEVCVTSEEVAVGGNCTRRASRRIRSRSIMYSATAHQMMTKPIHRSDDMCSRVTNTAHSSSIVGVAYSSMPMVDD